MTGAQHDRHVDGRVLAISPVGIITFHPERTLHRPFGVLTINPSVSITLWNSENMGIVPNDRDNRHWGITVQFQTETEALSYGYDNARIFGITNLI